MNLLAALLLCAAVQIDGPQQLAVGEYGDFAIRGLSLEQAKNALVDVWPEATVRPLLTWAGEPLLLFRAATPGQYRLLVVAPLSADRLAVAKTVVQVGASRPDPKPPTPPGPPPTDKAFGLILYRTDKLRDYSEGHIAVLKSQRLHDAFRARGGRLLVLDADASVGQNDPMWAELERIARKYLESNPDKVVWALCVPKGYFGNVMPYSQNAVAEAIKQLEGLTWPVSTSQTTTTTSSLGTARPSSLGGDGLFWRRAPSCAVGTCP